MGFRREVRSFIKEVRDWMKVAAVGTAVYKEMIKEQQKLINSLHDRLMSRNYPELKTFALPDLDPKIDGQTTNTVLFDEDIAGAIVQLGDCGQPQ